MIEKYISQGVFYLRAFNTNMSEWRERIRSDYQETFSMPRKMKKQRRKELILDWSIACYDPFSNF